MHAGAARSKACLVVCEVGLFDPSMAKQLQDIAEGGPTDVGRLQRRGVGV